MAKSVREAMTEEPRSIGASASVVEAARRERGAAGWRTLATSKGIVRNL
jgi:hypothetical protein